MKNSALILVLALCGFSATYGQKLVPTQKEGWGSTAPWGYKNDKGILVIPYKYDGAGFFEEDGLAAVSITYRHGFIDKSGNEVIPLIYDNAGYYAQGLAPVCRKGKWGFIDTKGKQVISFSYYDALPHHDGLAAVKRKEKWGYIDTKGKEIIPFIYDYAGYFEQGLAPVKPKGVKEIGFINTKGEMVIPVQFKATTGFNPDGTARVLKEGVNMEQFYSIDKTGKKIDIDALVAKMSSTQAAEAIAKNALEIIGAGNFEAALTEAEKALKLDANNFTALLARGFIYAAYNKDNTKAMDFYSKAISVNANDSRPFLFRSYVLVDNNRLVEAQKDLDKAIAIDAKCFDCFMLRASIFELQEKWADARDAASFARFANPYSEYAKSRYEKYKSLAEPKTIATNKTVNTYSRGESINTGSTKGLLDDEDEYEYKENPAYTRKKNKTSLSQGDMDNIIKSNSSSSSSGESGWDRYFRERERQSNKDYKIKNDGYRGY